MPFALRSSLSPRTPTPACNHPTANRFRPPPSGTTPPPADFALPRVSRSPIRDPPPPNPPIGRSRAPPPAAFAHHHVDPVLHRVDPPLHPPIWTSPATPEVRPTPPGPNPRPAPSEPPLGRRGSPCTRNPPLLDSASAGSSHPVCKGGFTSHYTPCGTTVLTPSSSSPVRSSSTTKSHSRGEIVTPLRAATPRHSPYRTVANGGVDNSSSEHGGYPFGDRLLDPKKCRRFLHRF
ncbi:uncharacterized protein LOC135162214 [Diachasmimorpha longicaudata]|uniref:uncharacterized protein LOC135162214 n=1 Tax=Diachasmimorpha longicaudata TaxID=58733 RepID=UPI0030B8C2DA